MSRPPPLSPASSSYASLRPSPTKDAHRAHQHGIQFTTPGASGSGHASLIGLVRLRPTRLKIDRQLVDAIDTSDEQRRVVKSIIEIAKALDVKVIAEGVESERHAATLARLGCDALQGFALSRPVPADEIDAKFSALVTS